jgi:hypothetical protein
MSENIQTGSQAEIPVSKSALSVFRRAFAGITAVLE